jgi:hypothetical protein
MDADEAVDWLWPRLESLPDTSFSDRLTDSPGELLRTLRDTARRIADGNGGQQDPEKSTSIFRKAKAWWDRIGFKLSDETTWGRIDLGKAATIQGKLREVEWTVELGLMLPSLASIMGCDLEQARHAFNIVANMVDSRSEMALHFIQRLLRGCGIACNKTKAHRVKEFLRQEGFLVKVRNHFHDSATGYRHGAFYVLGPGVRFVAPKAAGGLVLFHENGTTEHASTYRSPGTGRHPDPLMQARFWFCLDRFRTRRREYYELLRQAA